MNILNKKTKILIVTGGVFSSLGKGISSSSIGAMLKAIGYDVMIMKFDPYLNVDAGTMSPEQHGEVFVTHDGNETDLDIGNYERFLNINLPKESNVTAGKIYYEILKKERNGNFLGSTIQVVPHITTEIANKIINLSNKYESDFLIVEVGGTVGDIESIPFLEASRQLHSKYKNSVLFIHIVPLINMLTLSEEKTKPIQHSIKELMSLGIFPNLLFVRSKNDLDEKVKQKISLTTGVDITDIFSLANLKNIYYLPEILKKQGVHIKILKHFNMKPSRYNDNKKWINFIDLIESKKEYKTKIAIIGKYTKDLDAYLSVITSLKLAAFYEKSEIKIDLIDSNKITKENLFNLKNYDGILVPGGFGNRGIEGKILAIQFARENNIPLLGICLGMQLACIEFARNVLNLSDANSYEFDDKTKNPILKILDGKDKNKNLGGTLRLGNSECEIKKDTKAYDCYKSTKIVERHRHRYEFNLDYKNAFESFGFVFSGVHSTYKDLVEIIEIKDHKFFIGCQFHPEFTTKTLSVNPLFLSFLNASKKLI